MQRRASTEVDSLDRPKIEEKIIRSLQGESTSRELQWLSRWRFASPEHAQRYRDIRSIWELTDGIRNARERVGEPPPVDAVLEAARTRRSGVVPIYRSRRPGSRPQWWSWVAGAAAVALVAIGAGLLLTNRSPGNVYTPREVVTGESETANIALEDGSIVRLAPASRLVFSRDGAERNVVLDGRAFFAVSPTQGKLFRVRTSAGEVRVLGTRFQVQTALDRLDVLVIEGRVSLHAPGGVVEVGAAEFGRVRAGSAPTVTAVDDPDALLMWLDGFVAFQATPLAQIARELERRFGVPVVIQDSTIAERKVTARFTDEGFEEILTVICRVSDVRCDIRPFGVTIGSQADPVR